MLLNYTNRPLLFVYKDNLTILSNGRFQIDAIENLQRRDYLAVAGPALRVHTETVVVNVCFGIPVIQEILRGADEIPPGDDILIVSKQYADACRRLCRATDRLRVVTGGVYTPSVAFPVASIGLATVESCLPYSMPAMFDPLIGVSDVAGAVSYIREKRNELEKAVVPIPEINREAYIEENKPVEKGLGALTSDNSDHLPTFSY